MALASCSSAEDIGSPNLCKFCKDFDYDQLLSKAKYSHHASFSDLIASATAGCPICAFVVANIDEDFHPEEDVDHPVRCQFTPDLRSMIWTRKTFIASFFPCTTRGMSSFFPESPYHNDVFRRPSLYHSPRPCNPRRRPLCSVFAIDEGLVEQVPKGTPTMSSTRWLSATYPGH